MGPEATLDVSSEGFYFLEMLVSESASVIEPPLLVPQPRLLRTAYELGLEQQSRHHCARKLACRSSGGPNEAERKREGLGRSRRLQPASCQRLLPKPRCATSVPLTHILAPAVVSVKLRVCVSSLFLLTLPRSFPARGPLSWAGERSCSGVLPA